MPSEMSHSGRCARLMSDSVNSGPNSPSESFSPGGVSRPCGIPQTASVGVSDRECCRWSDGFSRATASPCVIPNDAGLGSLLSATRISQPLTNRPDGEVRRQRYGELEP